MSGAGQRRRQTLDSLGPLAGFMAGAAVGGSIAEATTILARERTDGGPGASFQAGAYGRGVTAEETFSVPALASAYLVVAIVTASEVEGDVGHATISDGSRPSHGSVFGREGGESGCTIALPTRGGATVTFTYSTVAGDFGDVLFAALPLNATV